MTVFWIWYRHWQRTIISSSEYSQTATGNVTQTSTVVSTAKIFAVWKKDLLWFVKLPLVGVAAKNRHHMILQ